MTKDACEIQMQMVVLPLPCIKTLAPGCSPGRGWRHDGIFQDSSCSYPMSKSNFPSSKGKAEDGDLKGGNRKKKRKVEADTNPCNEARQG